MDAIVLAGGEGSRLRPLTETRLKPMVPLPGGTILEHVLRLLPPCGVTRAHVTLRSDARAVTDRLGDGRALGLRLSYAVEDRPLGTAGSAAACIDPVCGEDVIVLPGDCVCDFDLGPALRFHRARGAEATILLTPRRDPREFGLARLGADGRILGFSEKPGWEGVFTDLVSTGIYLLRSSVLHSVPRGAPLDFGRDVFPQLLREGRGIYGYASEGYWQDAGTPEAYLACVRDMLRGRLRSFPMPPEGILSASPVPAGAEIVPPVWIDGGVTVEPGARIGPCAALGRGTRVCAGGRVEESAVWGARIGPEARAGGAILCPGAVLERGAFAGEGSVVADGALLEEGAGLLAGGKLWPGCRLAPGTRVSGAVRRSAGRASFVSPGVFRGVFGGEVTPELCARLGAGAALLGGRVGCVAPEGDGARLLAEAFGSGVCAAGGGDVRPDCAFEAQAAFAAGRWRLPVTAVFRVRGETAEIRFYGEDGLALGREPERALERALRDGAPLASAGSAGSQTVLEGVMQTYLAEAARPGACRGRAVAAAGSGPERGALAAALAASGASVSPPGSGCDVLTVTEGGFGLTAVTPDGRRISEEETLLAAVWAELEAGSGAAALQYDAPLAADTLASRLGGRVLRLGRDAGAEELASAQPFFRDGVFLAVRLYAYLTLRRMRLSALVSALPRYASARGTVPVFGDKAAVMRALAAGWEETAQELVSGLRIFSGRERATIRPLREENALYVEAEGESEAAARRLLRETEARIRDAGGTKSENS